MDVLQNMMLYSELVQCGGNVYTLSLIHISEPTRPY